MSNIQHIIEERTASIGNFMVGRLLPFREKRTVGPFAFIDHMGPAVLSEYENLDVGPHPHIGLSTLTYLFEGAILHRDSLGTEIEITPGEVNWMTAGKGIVHSERTPESLRHSSKKLHGLQIWIALPKELEECEPSFYHIGKEGLPEWERDDLHFKLIAGAFMGYRSQVPVHSKLYMLEIKSEKAAVCSIGEFLFGECGIYVLSGSIESDQNTFGAKQLLVAHNSALCQFTMAENTTIYIFGGEAFPEERFIYWNFVSSSKERIEQAKIQWEAQEFPKVPNETDFVPLPKPQF